MITWYILCFSTIQLSFLILASAAGHKRLLLRGYDPSQFNRTRYQLVRRGNESLFLATVRAMKDFSNGVSPDCSDLYGGRMISKFELDAHDVCEGGTVGDEVAEGALGRIRCRERTPFDIERYACVMQNVKISRNGTSVQGCTLTPWAQKAAFGVSEVLAFMGERRPETFTPPIFLDEDFRGTCIQMKQRAIFQIAWDTRNFYEWYGDWVTLWETLAILEWDPGEVEMFLVNPASDKDLGRKPFDEAWNRAFSGRVHSGRFKDLFRDGICFSEIATTPHGGLSTTTFHEGRGGVVSCSSPTVRASALYLETLFPYRPQTFSATMRQATLLMRAAGSSRAFVNDVDAENAVRAALTTYWKFRSYWPERVPSLAEQLWIVSQTDVLVGAHGAGMMHVLFLPPHASVVEIFCADRSEANHHYKNIFAMAADPGLLNVSRHYFQQPYSSDCVVESEIVRAAIVAFDQ